MLLKMQSMAGHSGLGAITICPAGFL
jgi:hypothetical protein